MTALERATLACIAGFLVGVFLASVCSVSWQVPALGALISVALFALFFLRKSPVLILAALLSLGCVFGMARFAVAEYDLRNAGVALAPYAGARASVVGVVAADPDAREASLRIAVAVESVNGEPVEAKRVLLVTDRHADISYGDRVAAVGMLEEPETFETDAHRVFDYPSFLKKDGVTHTIAFAEVSVLEQGQGHALVAALIGVKNAFSRGLEAALIEPYAALSQGLLLGEKQALGGEYADIFRTTGVIHIIVLSGYNIAIVAKFVAGLASRMRFGKRTQIVVAGFGIVAFIIAIGPSAASVRAVLMAVLVLAAHFIGRSADVFRLLLAAGAAMVLWNPYVLAFDPGFQLSFLATAGLIAFSPHIEKRLRFVPEAGGVREIATATIATQLAVLPHLIALMGEISLISLPANLLVLPAVAPAMALSAIAGGIGMVAPLLALPLSFLSYLPLGYIIHLPELLARLPFSSVVMPPVPTWFAALLFAAVFALVVAALRIPTPQNGFRRRSRSGS